MQLATHETGCPNRCFRGLRNPVVSKIPKRRALYTRAYCHAPDGLTAHAPERSYARALATFANLIGYDKTI